MIVGAPPPAAPATAADLETLALGLVPLDAEATDAFVARQVDEAVRERRIDDAVRWQRARLRARALRARAKAACRA